MKTFILLSCVLLLCNIIYTTNASIPWNVVQNGDFTYYDDKGYGACGTQIDASSQNLVAISKDWFTSSNPNKDQFCTNNVCVKVNYKGKSVQVPVKDKCPGCNKGHLDLSKQAFAKLAPLSVGHAYNATWSFVHC